MYTWAVGALLMAIAWVVLAGLPGSPLKGANRLIFLAGCAVIAVGYLMLSKGPVNNPLSLTWGPVLLVIGYCVIMPVALLRRRKTKPDSEK